MSTGRRPISDAGPTDIANKILEIPKAQKCSTTGEVESLKQELAKVTGRLEEEIASREHHMIAARNDHTLLLANAKEDLVKESARAATAEFRLSSARKADQEELGKVREELQREKLRAHTLEHDLVELKRPDEEMLIFTQVELEKEKSRADAAEHNLTLFTKELVEVREELTNEKIRADSLEHDLAELKSLDQNMLAKTQAELAEAKNSIVSVKNELAEEQRRTEAMEQSSKTALKDLHEALWKETTGHAVTRTNLDKVTLRCNQAFERVAELQVELDDAESGPSCLGVLSSAKATIALLEKELKLEKKQDSKATQMKLKKLTKDLEAAKKEADTSKGELHRVFDEMKNANGNGAHKRKVSADVTSRVGKKARALEMGFIETTMLSVPKKTAYGHAEGSDAT